MAKDNTYETFDSGAGPVIPAGDKDKYAHEDNGKGGYTKNTADDENGSVPETPSKSR